MSFRPLSGRCHPDPSRGVRARVERRAWELRSGRLSVWEEKWDGGCRGLSRWNNGCFGVILCDSCNGRRNYDSRNRRKSHGGSGRSKSPCRHCRRRRRALPHGQKRRDDVARTRQSAVDRTGKDAGIPAYIMGLQAGGLIQEDKAYQDGAHCERTTQCQDGALTDIHVFQYSVFDMADKYWYRIHVRYLSSFVIYFFQACSVPTSLFLVETRYSFIHAK